MEGFLLVVKGKSALNLDRTLKTSSGFRPMKSEDAAAARRAIDEINKQTKIGKAAKPSVSD